MADMLGCCGGRGAAAPRNTSSAQTLPFSKAICSADLGIALGALRAPRGAASAAAQTLPVCG